MDTPSLVLKGKLFNKVFTIPKGEQVTIGRGKDVDIQIFESELSRHHCIMECQNGDIYIEDLESSNGTWVNDARVARRRLNKGDRIRFGSIEFEFYIEAGDRTNLTRTSQLLPAVTPLPMKSKLDMLYGTVKALVATIEAKDRYTRGHSERVASYATQIARAMGLSESKLNALELACYLHDAGKIGVPESVLHKPGKLTDEEFAVIKQHPQMGYNILSQMEGTEAIAEIVLHHHERWDGNGYPDGTKEKGASLMSRILTVADTFDAMGSERPYRGPIIQKEVLAELKRQAGAQFDPHVVEVLLAEAAAGRIMVEADHAAQATLRQQAVDN